MTVRAEAQIIDGKAVADTIRLELKSEVAALKAQTGKAPGLAVVLVGQRKDSQTYVRSKKKGCEEVGIVSFGTDLPDTASEAEVLKVVQVRGGKGRRRRECAAISRSFGRSRIWRP